MKQFFSRITSDHWKAQNKLEEAAKNVALELERRIIPENKVEDFCLEAQARITEINDIFLRCKPLQLEIWQPRKEWSRTNELNLDHDISISVSGVFQMEVIKAKESV